jgi:phenylacetic acid degradation operon negative regulatory protein
MKARSTLFTIFGEFVHPRGDVVWVGTIIVWMNALGFSADAVRAAVSRSRRTGWLEVQKRGRQSYYALTPEVRWRVHQAVGRLYKPLERTWDGQWRVLTYSIPEQAREARDSLRKELLILGFGALQPGVWISPNNLCQEALELAKVHRLEQHVDAFEAKRFGVRTNLELVQSTWDVNALNSRFDGFLEQFKTLPKLSTPETAFRDYVQMLHEYRKFLFIDPDLPLELQPDLWRSREAALLFRHHRALLEPMVSAFVASTFED